MAELTEIPLKLQLKEANRRIKMHLSQGHKFQQFLSPMFQWRFPTIMENHISVDWNTILGIYDRMPTLPITLINTEILDDWFTHPSMWDVSFNLQHARRVLALVCYTLPTPYKGQPASVWGILCLYSHLPSMHEPSRWPDVPEECQGRLRSPGSDAIQANILSPTTERQILDSASYQWQPRRGSRSSTHVCCHQPPGG